MTNNNQVTVDKIIAILTPDLEKRKVNTDYFRMFVNSTNAEVILNDLEAYFTLDSGELYINMYFDWLKKDLITRTTPTGNNFLMDLIKQNKTL